MAHVSGRRARVRIRSQGDLATLFDVFSYLLIALAAVLIIVSASALFFLINSLVLTHDGDGSDLKLGVSDPTTHPVTPVSLPGNLLVTQDGQHTQLRGAGVASAANATVAASP